MQIVLASRNKGKIAEFVQLLSPLGLQVVSLLDLAEIPDVLEDGETFFANAQKKAEAICEATGLPALADDSGLVVHHLGGAPGVYSARFAEPEHGDTANNEKLLRLLERVPMRKRQAHFTAVLALARPAQATRFTVGRCFGFVLNEPKGENGFGYDPIFYVPELNQTFAELSVEIKNAISHRAKAMASMQKLLKQLV